MTRALNLIVSAIAFVKIGNIKNYASISQVCEFLDLFDDFSILNLDEKMKLLEKLNGRSAFFYKLKVEEEWVVCE